MNPTWLWTDWLWLIKNDFASEYFKSGKRRDWRLDLNRIANAIFYKSSVPLLILKIIMECVNACFIEVRQGRSLSILFVIPYSSFIRLSLLFMFKFFHTTTLEALIWDNHCFLNGLGLHANFHIHFTVPCCDSGRPNAKLLKLLYSSLSD